MHALNPGRAELPLLVFDLPVPFASDNYRQHLLMNVNAYNERIARATEPICGWEPTRAT
jgi:hypothetical protein